MPREPKLSFVVRGLPAPQGSKTAFVNPHTGKAGLKESSERVRPWRQDVAYAATQAIGDVLELTGERRWTPIQGPVALVIEFYMPRPASHPKSRRTLPITKPDLDKLQRSTLDALTSAGVYRDDSNVVELSVRERYAVTDLNVGHEWELPASGAVIAVFELDEEETWADLPLAAMIAERLPSKTVPSMFADAAEIGAKVLSLLGPAEIGQEVVVAADAKDSEVVAATRKVLAAAKRTLAAIDSGKPATWTVLRVEDGDRLASFPRKPMDTAQAAVVEVLGQPAEAKIALVFGRAAEAEVAVETVAAEAEVAVETVAAEAAAMVGA